ncbi:MAG: hypothetical protein JZU65_21620 [Chlorobium sp.]|nr:hypothetical protein [Chlorobium sp.]
MDNPKYGLTQLLYLIVRFTGFKRLRLYVIDRQKNKAVLCSAVDDQNKEQDMAPIYGGLQEIPLNIRKVFNDEIIDPLDFCDFIGRFRYEKYFIVDLLNLKNIPLEVGVFHRNNGIKQIGVISIWENDNFIGYIAVDKSNDYISLIDMQSLDECISMMSQTIVNILNGIESEKQQRILMEISERVIWKMKHECADVVIDYLLGEVFSICRGGEILQVKQILQGERGYKYLYVRVNPNSDITKGDKDKILCLEGKEFSFSDNRDFVTLEVYKNNAAKYISDTRKLSRDKSINIGDEQHPEEGEDEEIRKIIIKRNYSEVNIPFRFGRDIFCVIDLHGRHPYALNKNSVNVLRDMALWFTVLLNERQYNFNYNLNKINAPILDAINNYEGRLLEKNDESGNYYVFNYWDMRDVANYINYNNHIKFVEVYKGYLDKMSVYKGIKGVSKMGLLLSIASLPLAFFSKYYFMIPFVPLFGIMTSLAFHWMAKQGSKEFNKKFAVNMEQIKDFGSSQNFVESPTAITS